MTPGDQLKKFLIDVQDAPTDKSAEAIGMMIKHSKLWLSYVVTDLEMGIVEVRTLFELLEQARGYYQNDLDMFGDATIKGLMGAIL